MSRQRRGRGTQRSGEAAAHPERVRLDRWLWAARFYKTRSLAKQAIEAGKVRCHGQRAKASREIGAGDELAITRGEVVQEIEVAAVCQRRGGALEARRLYRETPASIERREAQRAERPRFGSGIIRPPARPDKRDRRQLQQLKHQDPER